MSEGSVSDSILWVGGGLEVEVWGGVVGDG